MKSEREPQRKKEMKGEPKDLKGEPKDSNPEIQGDHQDKQ